MYGYHDPAMCGLTAEKTMGHVYPYYVLPATPEIYEAQVEAMVLSSLYRGYREINGKRLNIKRFLSTSLGQKIWPLEVAAAREYLAAIGIKRRKSK